MRAPRGLLAFAATVGGAGTLASSASGATVGADLPGTLSGPQGCPTTCLFAQRAVQGTLALALELCSSLATGDRSLAARAAATGIRIELVGPGEP